jgi:cell wall-associated NlpC family hydrolase
LGLDAFHFRHEDGLYKVRFGDFRTYREARAAGTRYKREGRIGFFFIISPASYRISNKPAGNTIPVAAGEAVRKDLLATAARFLGIPYRWGGTSAANGFDCSGLTLTVYRLNGLKLPRSAAAQMQAGKPVSRAALKTGDLVFFDTMRRGTISHVGMYAGGGRFIHAPRRGKAVQFASLDNSYFRRTWRGARSYF